MTPREASNRYKLSQWVQMFADRRTKETVDEFCERNVVTRPQYFYWQRKLRKAALQAQNDSADAETALVPSGWSVCEPAETEPSTKALTIEIGKFNVSIDSDFNPEQLKKVCEVLVTLC
jgi:hypothetical protein